MSTGEESEVKLAITIEDVNVVLATVPAFQAAVKQAAVERRLLELSNENSELKERLAGVSDNLIQRLDTEDSMLEFKDKD
jgi:hypothetical protein